MKTHPSLFMSVVLTFFITMAAAWSDLAAAASITLVVPFAGTAGGLNEAVDVTGNAKITATSIPGDPTSPPGTVLDPGVLVDIQVLNVHGQGQSSHKQYVANGNDIDRVVRTLLLAPSQQVEFGVPIFPANLASSANKALVLSSATSALVSITLNFDTTGKLTKATALPVAPN